jgi:hypothetical protein
MSLSNFYQKRIRTARLHLTLIILQWPGEVRDFTLVKLCIVTLPALPASLAESAFKPCLREDRTSDMREGDDRAEIASQRTV